MPSSPPGSPREARLTRGTAEDLVSVDEIAGGIARRFRGRGVEVEDLEQVACLGLVKAAISFRLEAGVPSSGTPYRRSAVR
jgi:hypothetical protein